MSARLGSRRKEKPRVRIAIPPNVGTTSAPPKRNFRANRIRTGLHRGFHVKDIAEGSRLVFDYTDRASRQYFEMVRDAVSGSSILDIQGCQAAAPVSSGILLGDRSLIIVKDNKIERLPVARSVVQISFGFDHFLALLEDGKVLSCMTEKAATKNYIGKPAEEVKPGEIFEIQNLPAIKKVLALKNASAFLSVRGEVYIFGSPFASVKGCVPERPVPLKIGKVVDISGGSAAKRVFFTMKDGTVMVLGRNDFGQAGTGTKQRVFDAPRPIRAPRKMVGHPVKISTSEHASFILTSSGQVYSAGVKGQNGLDKQTNYFTLVPYPSKVLDLSCSSYETFVLTEDRTIFVHTTSKSKLREAMNLKEVNKAGAGYLKFMSLGSEEHIYNRICLLYMGNHLPCVALMSGDVKEISEIVPEETPSPDDLLLEVKKWVLTAKRLFERVVFALSERELVDYHLPDDEAIIKLAAGDATLLELSPFADFAKIYNALGLGSLDSLAGFITLVVMLTRNGFSSETRDLILQAFKSISPKDLSWEGLTRGIENAISSLSAIEGGESEFLNKVERLKNGITITYLVRLGDFVSRNKEELENFLSKSVEDNWIGIASAKFTKAYKAYVQAIMSGNAVPHASANRLLRLTCEYLEGTIGLNGTRQQILDSLRPVFKLATGTSALDDSMIKDIFEFDLGIYFGAFLDENLAKKYQRIEFLGWYTGSDGTANQLLCRGDNWRIDITSSSGGWLFFGALKKDMEKKLESASAVIFHLVLPARIDLGKVQRVEKAKGLFKIKVPEVPVAGEYAIAFDVPKDGTVYQRRGIFIK